LPIVRTLAINPVNSTLYAALPRQSDAFIAKIDPSGSVLDYSTFLGGIDGDEANGIAVDGSGAYLVGSTKSLNFPTQSAVRPTFGGGTCGTPTIYGEFGVTYARLVPCSDVFIAKINPSGAALAYSTYMGGTNDDYGRGIAVDNLGNAYVTGLTASLNFPLVNAFQSTLHSTFHDGYYVYSDQDAFVTKIDSTGSSLVYSTFLGGYSYDEGRAIAVDATGAATVVGQTYSLDFPTLHPLKCAEQEEDEYPPFGPPADAFITILAPAGNNVSYSTRFGGSSRETANAVALDHRGDIYLTGATHSDKRFRRQ